MEMQYKKYIELDIKTKLTNSFDEAIKTLRTNVQFSGKNLKSIMFTSSIPGEGKSSISFRFALSLADLGKKVLYIDADLRKSVFGIRYKLQGENLGLSQYLSGQCNKEDILYSTNIENLDLVLAGPYSPNPTELLEEEEFNKFLKLQTLAYDYIIIDAPPLISVIDAAIIAKYVDGAIIVVESEVTSYKLAIKVKEQLEKADCRILGVVLNKINQKSSPYYNKYYGKYEKYEK